MQKRMKKQNNKGFSLVELLVVMAIMAILTGAIAPQVNKYVEKSRESRDLQLVSTVFTAVQTGIVASETPVPDISNKTLDFLLDAGNNLLTTATINEINDLLGDDLSSVANIKKKCVSRNGSKGSLYVDYKANGKLTVYISTNGNVTNTDNIGPVTN